MRHLLAHLFFVILLGPIPAQAHTLTLQTAMEDNGHLLVRGEFSTGQPAAGALLKVTSTVDGKLLFQKRLPRESELVIPIPKMPYRLILDGGPRHMVVQEGPPPGEGFSRTLPPPAGTGPPAQALDRIPAGHILWGLSGMLWLVILAFGMRCRRLFRHGHGRQAAKGPGESGGTGGRTPRVSPRGTGETPQ